MHLKASCNQETRCAGAPRARTLEGSQQRRKRHAAGEGPRRTAPQKTWFAAGPRTRPERGQDYMPGPLADKSPTLDRARLCETVRMRRRRAPKYTTLRRRYFKSPAGSLLIPHYSLAAGLLQRYAGARPRQRDSHRRRKRQLIADLVRRCAGR